MASVSDSPNSILTPAVLTLDTQHNIFTSPTAWIGGITAFLITIKTFVWSMSGMSGYLGTSAMPYYWNTLSIMDYVFTIIVMVAAVLGILLVGIFSSNSSCCTFGAPLARKSFRHLYTMIITHVVHFTYGACMLIVRLGYSTIFAGTTIIPVADKSAFYFFNGIEVLFGIWAIGAFISALPFLFFPEADSRRAAAYATIYAERQPKGQP